MLFGILTSYEAPEILMVAEATAFVVASVMYCV
jgi:hypothetical protein